ncbi:MAG: Omp28-related outer membrane protein [Phaeodactylibacter sp.]|nr:Omp28-related outer membrane protein [Phaeodactylibacter sp.]
MQRILTVTIFALLFTNQIARAQAKQYLLLEHFTNTVCPICANANPGFYNTISNYEGDYHHIAYHPSVPYSSCIFYQANTEENGARQNYYNIFGTPRVYLNGTTGVSAGQVTASLMENNLGQTSPLAIQVTETGVSNRQVEVEVFSQGPPPAGDLRLFVAVVEKEIQYNAPNGETLHHDVFRDMLTDKDGDPFTPASEGGSVTAYFNFSVQMGWQQSQVYVLAFVQDYSTREVYNSGTRFDPVISSTAEELGGKIRLYPNPVQEEAVVEFPEPATGILTIRDALGQTLLTRQAAGQHSVRVNVQNLPAGMYWASFESGKERWVQPFSKN